MLRGKVGIAPGTTTMRLGSPGLGSPWAPGYPDPSQKHMPKNAFIVGGAMVPHDFELAKIYGYTPYMEGWVVGAKTDQPPGIFIDDSKEIARDGFAGFGYSGLGQTAPSQEETDRQLMLKRYEEEMKTMRWNRIVGGISAVAAVGALVISIAAFKRRR